MDLISFVIKILFVDKKIKKIIFYLHYILILISLNIKKI